MIIPTFLKIFFINIFVIITSQKCQNDMTINVDINCFNKIMQFNSKNYRAGHFAINNKGDMVVEYSDEHSRLFYGFKNNGRYYFETENNIKEINYLENINQPDAYPRYESNNIFVYLVDDINKEKAYLFSTSSYISTTELHDLENDNYKVKTTKDFMGSQIYGYVIPLLEAKYNNNNLYFCIFNNDNSYGRDFVIKRFGFKSFELTSNEFDKTITKSYSHTNRIISSFILEEDDILAVFYMDSTLWYNLDLYDFDLNLLKDRMPINAKVIDSAYFGIFFKGIYLKEKYASLMYFLNNGDGKTLYIEILDFTLQKGNYNFNSVLKLNINKYNFNTYLALNEFVKVNPERLIYITTINYHDLYILFFDLYNNYSILKTRLYFLNFPLYELKLELSACIFNNFLAFTGTFYYTNYDRLFSLFILFGFPKGIDSVIDISPYILDSESYNSNYNLINLLMENFVIENNLFNYEKINQIKLVSIPGEIIFYNEDNPLPLSNGEILTENYRLINNKEIIKENKYYELHYQYVVKEQDFTLFYQYEQEELNFGSNDGTNDDIEFNQIIYYGRTNILKFKLCYDLCETCDVYGTSNFNQKCLTCPSLYDYNYFTTIPLNCIQEGYFQDNEEKIIIKCNEENSKFYFDKKRNKKICFKFNYNCPNDYSNFNETTNECMPTPYYESMIQDLKNSNYLNEEILSKIISVLIPNYNGENDAIIGRNNTIFQITTEENEMKILKGLSENNYNLTVIDLGDCEDKLRENYHIDKSIPLIILKAEKISTTISQKSLQYEVYNSQTLEQLNLSICDNKINIYYPIKMEQNEKDVYENLNKFGYDYFDINNKFYQDICSTYETKYGTDIILSDRINDIYNKNYSCPSNCEYSSYSNSLGYLNCECSIENKNITIGEISNLVIKSFIFSFNTLNYKFIKCYKLVLNLNIFIKNLGNWFLFILFLAYLVFLILYIIKGINPLIKEVNNFLEKKKKKQNKIVLNITDNISHNENNKSNNSINMNESKKKLNITNIKFHKTKVNELIIVNKKEKNKNKLNKNDNLDTDKNNKNNKDINLNNIIKKIYKKIKYRKNKSFIDLDNLNYEEAIKNDKRSFIKMFLSKLRRQHIIIFTFCSENDFNLIYIKLAKFCFAICINISINALFFSDESIHKINLNYGKYNLVQQIPQILYSSLISLIIDLLISFLTLSETQIYTIIRLKEKNPKKNKKEIDKIYRFIKIKFVLFFSITFLPFIFFWYFVTAFCAVYENTQITFLKDFVTSFFTEFTYPFFLYYILAFFRKISLKDKAKKRLKFLYIIGNL